MNFPKQPSFNSHRNQGFQMTFANGYIVSVQFGDHHYCSMRNLNRKADDWKSGDDTHSSSDAEVAILDPDGQFVQFDSTSDFVKGHVDPDTVAKIIAWVVALPKNSS
jgi:hypothetical protein